MRYLLVAIGLLAATVFAASCANDLATIAGCAGFEERRAKTIERAREFVLASELLLNPNEIEFIKLEDPEVATYALTGPCGEDSQYFVEWEMPEGRIVISGIGNLYEMDNATVRRVAK